MHNCILEQDCLPHKNFALSHVYVCTVHALHKKIRPIVKLLLNILT